MPTTPSCFHVNTLGECAIASNIAGRPVVPWENVCDTCSRCESPRQANYVTASIAVHEWERRGALYTAATLRDRVRREGLLCKGRQIHRGFGWMVGRVIGWIGIKPRGECRCKSVSTKMNKAGAIGVARKLPYFSGLVASSYTRRQGGVMWQFCRCGALAIIGCALFLFPLIRVKLYISQRVKVKA